MSWQNCCHNEHQTQAPNAPKHNGLAQLSELYHCLGFVKNEATQWNSMQNILHNKILHYKSGRKFWVAFNNNNNDNSSNDRITSFGVPNAKLKKHQSSLPNIMLITLYIDELHIDLHNTIANCLGKLVAEADWLGPKVRGRPHSRSNQSERSDDRRTNVRAHT